MKTELTGSAAEAAQKFLQAALNRAGAAEKKYRAKAWWRYWLALALKAIALLGGIAVATLASYQVLLGVIISVAVAVDQLFSNHSRMITETIASDAIARTLRKVEDDYQHEVVLVIKRAGTDAEGAKDQLMELARKSSQYVRTELDRIQKAVEDANIQFLSSLNIDTPTTPAPKV
jgi:hypothetical protein